LFSVCVVATIACAVIEGCAAEKRGSGPRVVVLGVDGLDYSLAQDLMARGRMPHFAQLAQSGRFSALATSTPPQSPVAWSTFITGLDPGQHGIFDFIHRDPKTMVPFLSTSRTVSGGRSLTFGRWQFPLEAGHVDLLREGQAFWDVLEKHGVRTTIIRVPADFPPTGQATRELSGMGTPDLLGTYGTFSFVTSQPSAFEGKPLSGGVIVPVEVVGSVVRGAIGGPDNPYLVGSKKTHVDFTAYLDRQNGYAKLVVGDEERLLRVGEWSDWLPVRLKLLPFDSLAGECRFYLKQIEPYFELYASPINIDPMKPALPISSPPGYAAELARDNGRFYTQGMPEDTKSLKTGVLSPDEFLQQARIAADENVRQYWHVLDRFEGGFLFYYFGNIDMVSHMMWRAMVDPQDRVSSTSDLSHRFVVEDLYVGIDQLVGETLARLQPNDLLVVMSDHGFAPWRRSFSLNSWLRDNGYLTPRDPDARLDPGLLSNVDWTRTRAYALGLNGLYVNVRDREAHGIVEPGERRAVAAEIARRLQQTIDPATGMPAVSRAFLREDVYHVGGHEDLAPDVIVGYAKGTRTSDESALGAVPQAVFADNADPWGADHCMDPAAVPGILLTNRPLRKAAPSLQTLASALVAEFGIEGFPKLTKEK
jgi:predicted AlkP superfamily phosphohydrolase/phosphomutase